MHKWKDAWKGLCVFVSIRLRTTGDWEDIIQMEWEYLSQNLKYRGIGGGGKTTVQKEKEENCSK